MLISDTGRWGVLFCFLIFSLFVQARLLDHQSYGR